MKKRNNYLFCILNFMQLFILYMFVLNASEIHGKPGVNTFCRFYFGFVAVLSLVWL